MTSEDILEIAEVVAKNHSIEDMDRIEELAGSAEIILEDHYNGNINDEVVAQLITDLIK